MKRRLQLKEGYKHDMWFAIDKRRSGEWLITKIFYRQNKATEYIEAYNKELRSASYILERHIGE